jgi:hypothetical protein
LFMWLNGQAGLTRWQCTSSEVLSCLSGCGSRFPHTHGMELHPASGILNTKPSVHSHVHAGRTRWGGGSAEGLGSFRGADGLRDLLGRVAGRADMGAAGLPACGLVCLVQQAGLEKI